MTKEEWEAVYAQKGGYWKWNNDGKRLHARIVSSGVCTLEFFNTDRVLRHPVLVVAAMKTLLAKAQGVGLRLEDVDAVVGPAMGAIVPSYEVTRQINEGRDETECLNAYVMKNGDTMEFRRMRLNRGMRVLIVEDVNATGRSIAATKKAVELAGCTALPHVLMFVDRTASDTIADLKVSALLTHEVKVYQPYECPACKAGSKWVDPKIDGNWEPLIDEAA